jgi:hypothetical protein
LPEKRNERKSCHDCGLEDFEACETENKHRGTDNPPCRFCVRNPEKVGWYDFYNEQWTLDTKGNPIFDDLTPHNVTLLKTLHGIIQKEIDQTPVQEVST